MAAPAAVAELVERFDSHRDADRSGQYDDSAKTAHQNTVIQRQIEATDREIDRLVYELYEPSDEEIAIVEEATA